MLTMSHPKREAQTGRARQSGHRYIVLTIALAAGIANFWDISRPSLWRDEAATADIAARTPSQILAVTAHVDAVLAPYYLFIHAWTRVAGLSELALRAPSAIAMSVAAAGVSLFGLRMSGRVAGVAAGGLMIAIPNLGRYAQEARPYALVLSCVVVATLLIHRLGVSTSARAWIAYGVAMELAVLFHIVAVTIFVPHVIYGVWRSLPRVRFLAAAVPALLTASAVALIGRTQSDAIAWINPPTVGSLFYAVPDIVANRFVALILVIGSLAYICAKMLGDQRRWPEGVLLASWAALVPLIWAGSHVFNVSLPRYMLFTLPAFVLMTAIACANVWKPLAVVIVVWCLYLSVPSQILIRQDDGHLGSNYRAAVQLIRDHARFGDAVVMDPNEPRWGYHYYATRDGLELDDPLLVARGAAEGSLMDISRGCSTAAPIEAPRVWLFAETGIYPISLSPDSRCLQGFRSTRVETFGNVTVTLLEP